MRVELGEAVDFIKPQETRSSSNLFPLNHEMDEKIGMRARCVVQLEIPGSIPVSASGFVRLEKCSQPDEKRHQTTSVLEFRS